MDPGADLELERPDGLDDRLRAAHGAGGSVERCEEPVSGGVDLDPVIPPEDRADRGVVALDGLPPSSVAELGRLLGRSDDVREQHGREHPIERRLLVAHRTEESADLLDHRRHVAVPGEVVRALELDEPSPRDVASQVAAFLDVIHDLVLPMHDERGGLHRTEHASDVGLPLELVQRHRHPRARRLAVVAGPERDRLGIEAHRWAEVPQERFHVVRLSPALLDLAIVRVPLLGAPGPRILLVLQAAGERPEQDERCRPVRIRRREEDRERSGRVHAEERRSLGARGLHHRQRVRHPRLQGRKSIDRQWVGEACATGVEEHETSDRRESHEEGTERGVRPEQFDVRVGGCDHQHIDRPVAGDLVRDVGPVGGSRVVDVGRLHAPILCLSGAAGQADEGIVGRLGAMAEKLRVIVAKPGLDGHDRGAKVVARALRDAGFEVIYTGLFQTPEQIAEAAIQEDADAVGLSCHSGAHMTLFPKVVKELRARGADDVVVVAGGVIPADDIPKLKEAGIEAVFTPGANTGDIATWLRDRLSAKA